jgi:hypothetical protein
MLDLKKIEVSKTRNYITNYGTIYKTNLFELFFFLLAKFI